MRLTSAMLNFLQMQSKYGCPKKESVSSSQQDKNIFLDHLNSTDILIEEDKERSYSSYVYLCSHLRGPFPRWHWSECRAFGIPSRFFRQVGIPVVRKNMFSISKTNVPRTTVDELILSYQEMVLFSTCLRSHTIFHLAPDNINGWF